jgi:hypothetical protein
MLHYHLLSQDGINDVFRVGREHVDIFGLQLSETAMQFPSYGIAAYCELLLFSAHPAFPRRGAA